MWAIATKSSFLDVLGILDPFPMAVLGKKIQVVEATIQFNSIASYGSSSLRLKLQNRKIVYILVKEDPRLRSIS